MIYEFFTSRNNLANVATFVGQAGRLFYDGATGVLKISDGITPGGANVQLPVATTTLLGGIKAGPGANVSIDGTLTIDTTGLPLSIGNIQITNSTISATNANADLNLVSNGTGNVELVGNVQFSTTAEGVSGSPYFKASGDGQITMYVPIADANTGAVRIIGSTTGDSETPGISGAMLHVTGNFGIPNRIYYDGNGDYVSWVARRWNGNLAAQTQVLAGQDVLRINATAYNLGGMPNVAIAQIGLTSLENQTTTAQGSKIGFTVTPIGSSAASRIEVANVTVANGVSATKFTGPLTGNVVGNLTGTVLTAAQPNITSVGTLSGLSVTDGITSGGIVSDRYGSLRSIPLNTQSSAYILTADDNGNLVSITTGNVTVNAGIFGTPYGQAISVFNNSTNTMSIVQGTNVTLRLAGTAATGTRSLARYGVASLICVAANTFVISGAGIS